MLSIFSKTQTEFSQAIFERFGKGRRHAALLYSQWFKEGKVDALWAEPQARSLVEAMIQATDWTLPPITRELKEGETLKFVLQMSDGFQVESVAIPMQSGITLCVSSQVGCKMGCAFCETGRMGLLRSLTVSEIVSQLFVAKWVLKIPVRNIVFMGMGEPFDNYEGVMATIRLMTDPGGFGLGPSRITVSTSGVVDQMHRFSIEADPAINLAVSVNAPTDEIRRKIMPVNRRWNLQALKEAMIAYCAHPRREILIEYVLLKDINDSAECALELGRFLEDLRVKINLIPYNSQRKSRFAAPEPSVQEAFMLKLRSIGYHVLLRNHKGREIMAACGQLGNRLQCV